MKKIILISLIFVANSLSALSYQETVRAYEEALENQNPEVYLLKCQREDQRNIQIRKAYRNACIRDKENELQKMINENFERLK